MQRVLPLIFLFSLMSLTGGIGLVQAEPPSRVQTGVGG